MNDLSNQCILFCRKQQRSWVLPKNFGNLLLKNKEKTKYVRLPGINVETLGADEIDTCHDSLTDVSKKL